MPQHPYRIGLVTDSGSQITTDLVSRYQIEVVPLTVTVDGVDYLEGETLDADGFYALFADGSVPEISTSQPSPGRFAEAYQRLADAGCREIVSIHLAAAMSGTIASATLAAETASVPVHVIDTGAASFGVAACVWAAASARDGGASVAEMRARIADIAPRIGTAFIVGVPLLIERGGRAAAVDMAAEGVPVLVMSDGNLEVLDRVASVERAIEVMSGYVTSRGMSLTVAIGTADESSKPLAQHLEAELVPVATIDRVVHYRIGPSVGAHTGPGTFGLFVFPTIRSR